MRFRAPALFAALFLAGTVFGQEKPAAPTPAVNQVDFNDLSALSRDKSRVIVGTLQDESGHGHVVIVVPGTNRVYDGNILGALKDSVDNKAIVNPVVQRKLEKYLTREYGDPDQYQKLLAKKGDPVTLDTLLKDKSPEERTLEVQKLLDAYLKKGNATTQSFDSKDLKEGGPVKWYAVPGDPAKAMAAVSMWTPPTPKSAEEQNLRCNDLVKAVAPIVKEIVPEGRAVTANTITSALRTEEEATRKTAPPPTVERPPEPENKPIIEDKSREQKVVPKPGGVILAPAPVLEGVDAGSVSSASIDVATGVLTLSLADGTRIPCTVDVDDFAIAVRSIFDRGADPSLSMRRSDKPGYHAVDYCGPLFKTRFGKVLYEADKLLGAIIFNREGPHQATVSDLIPAYSELACEAHATMMTGSRVFLRASGAAFSVQDGRLVPGAVTSVIDVEGLGYGASYYQESLHRLARILDSNFDALAESFEPFQEFRRLARLVAIAKWLKNHSIAFDRAALDGHKVSEHEFPAYSPTTNWYSMFNGRNLDGWTCSLSSSALETSSGEGSVTLRPTGEPALEVFSETWANSYDLKFILSTEGPVEIVLRAGSGEAGASVTLDTKGEARKVECFLADGTWTVVTPESGSKGTVKLPVAEKDKARESNRYGLRVPPGSKMTLFSASLRTR